MKNNDTLSKKLLAYSGMATTIFLMSKQSFAQIIYTDINPDSMLHAYQNHHDSLLLDLNNDGQFDFKILETFNSSESTETWLTRTWKLTAMAYGNNRLMRNAGSYIDTLELNDTISQNQNWISQGVLGYYQIQWHFSSSAGSVYDYWIEDYGLWLDVTDKFIGLQLIAGNDTLYGWVRLDAKLSNQWDFVKVKDYAYDTIPNELILAGATGGYPLQQENVFATQLKITPNPASSIIIIHNPMFHSSLVTIANASGKIVKQLTVADNSGNVVVTVDDLPVGIYLVTLNDGEKSISKKVVIAR
jgi:hypothetical protein